MSDSCKTPYGAMIEKGKITEATENGYRIASGTRDGIITPPIKAIINKNHAIGDSVYFALFEDGDGIILN